MDEFIFYHVCNDYSLSRFSGSDSVKGPVVWKNGGKLNRAPIELGWQCDELVYLRTKSNIDIDGKYL